MAPFVRIRVVTWASVLAVGLCAIAGARGTAMAANDTPPAIDESAARAAIADLLERIPEMNIASMPALSVQRFTLPSAGVDVMRARVQESYTIEGIGTETVELNGWIAVLHRDPVTIREGEVARWGNVVIGTEFVALDLRGESDLFGPIQVRLNPAMPSLGEVGWWEKEPCHTHWSSWRPWMPKIWRISDGRLAIVRPCLRVRMVNKRWVCVATLRSASSWICRSLA